MQRLTGSAPLGGVIWHTQRQVTDYGAAGPLLRADSTSLANPTMLVLTDRRDLDKQIFDTFRVVGTRAIQVVSVAGLLTMLGIDYGSVFTSTV